MERIAPASPSVACTMMGFEFLMGYGLTETSPVIAVTTTKYNVYGSVGRPLTGIEVKIDTDSPKIGTVGEILSKSDCVMQGYYENPEATAEVLEDDGWFHTGDMGFLDKKGCLHITGGHFSGYRISSPRFRTTAADTLLDS